MIGTGTRMNRSFSESLSGLLKNFELIRILTVDELRRTYTGSLMGLSWILVKPVLLISLYGVLFGIVFQVRSGPRQTGTEYLFVLLAGLLPWLIFSEAVSAAAGSITANTSLVTKIVFPIEVLPVSKVLGTMLSGLVSLTLLVVVLAYLNRIGWTLVLLPVMIMAQLVFTIGLAWFLSAVHVAIRDTSQVLPFVLMVWMFLSPVVYTSEMVPKALAVVFWCNPMSYFLEGYRMILLANQPPSVLIWVVVIVMTVMIFLSGFWVLCRMRTLIADFI